MHVNYFALADHTGYANAALQYMELLVSQGVDVSFHPLLLGLRPGQKTLGFWYELASPGDVEDPFLRSLAQRLFLPEADAILHTVPEYYPGLLRWLAERGHKGRRLGMTVWETSRIPAHWAALVNSLDGVIVPSPWNASLFAEGGVSVPISVLGHASEFEGRVPDPAALDLLLARLPDVTGKFIFYSIGTWQIRKGNDLLLRAFARAFGHRTDVVLILKTTRESMRGPQGWWRRRIENVIFLTDDLSGEEIAALHTIGDCYVSCSRGEGWGLGIFEATFYGKPAIVPALGGHRVFFPEHAGSGLIRSRWLPVPRKLRYESYSYEQSWVEVNVLDAAARMRRIVRNPESARAEAVSAAAAIRVSFGRVAIATGLKSILYTKEPSSEKPGQDTVDATVLQPPLRTFDSEHPS